MNFKILNDNINFSNEFVKLNEIRGIFLEEALNSVSTFRNKFKEKFNDNEQVKKDAEAFGYEYLKQYISKAIGIIKDFNVKNINEDEFFKDYYLLKYYTWENTINEIKNNEKSSKDESNIILPKLNISSGLIKTPYEIKEKEIEIEFNEQKIKSNISNEILDKLSNSMMESIFNINFAIIDFLNDNNVKDVENYSDIKKMKKSNKLIKELLKNEVSKGREIATIKEIIQLNPYNENIYKALLYKYGDKDNELERLGEFLGYNNIHNYKEKLLNEYYKTLNTSTNDSIVKAKENLILFANKLSIKDYNMYIEKLDELLNKENLKDTNELELKENELNDEKVINTKNELNDGKVVNTKNELNENKIVKETEVLNSNVINEVDPKENIEVSTVDLDTEPNGNNELKGNKKNASNKGLIITTCVLSCILGVYLLMTLYFNSHFFFRTSINNISISGKSNKSAQELMSDNANEYVLTIEERNNKTETITGESISLKYDFSNNIDRILKSQNPFLWISSIFRHKNYEFTDGINYDESLLNKYISELDALNESMVTNPVNAKLNYNDGKYEIIKEDIGNKVNRDLLNSKILEKIISANKTLNLDEEGCYENPIYTSKSKEVIAAKDTADKYVKAKITFNVNGNSENIDGNMISQWIVVGEDFNVSLNEDAIREYTNQLGDKYDNIGETRTVTRWSGEQIKISTTPGIYYVDRNTTISEIEDAIKSGKSVTKDLTFKTPTATDEYVLNTFVEVDLTNQTVIYYKNGEVITQGNVVTGNVSQGHATPAGVYKLDWKAKDYVLRGQGYASPVNFWMPFNGGIGLHDASWRSQFGGSIYKTNGSHGCVNMTYSVAKAIYDNIEEYTTIICKY